MTIRTLTFGVHQFRPSHQSEVTLDNVTERTMERQVEKNYTPQICFPLFYKLRHF